MTVLYYTVGLYHEHSHLYLILYHFYILDNKIYTLNYIYLLIQELLKLDNLVNVHALYHLNNFLDFQNIGNDEFRGMGFCVIHAVPDNGIFRGESALLLLRDGDEREQVLSSSTGQIMDFDHGLGGYPSSLMGSLGGSFSLLWSTWTPFFQNLKQTCGPVAKPVLAT